MSTELAPALTYLMKELLVSVSKLFLSVAKDDLVLLRAYDLEGAQIYEYGKSESSAQLNQLVLNQLPTLQTGQIVIEQSEASLVLLQPARLASDEIAGYVGLIWSRLSCKPARGIDNHLSLVDSRNADWYQSDLTWSSISLYH